MVVSALSSTVESFSFKDEEWRKSIPQSIYASKEIGGDGSWGYTRLCFTVWRSNYIWWPVFWLQSSLIFVIHLVVFFYISYSSL